MRQEKLLPYRRRTISSSRRVVLEIGVGTGLNLPLYRDVDCVCAIDPASEVLEYAKQRMKQARSRVLLARTSAEKLPFTAGSFDTVVMTWTLCTIPDPLVALREMRRVLKPEGRLLFVEHGLAPDRNVAWWQDKLTPLWRRASGGCHLNRKTDELIRAAGFRIEELHTGYMDGPKPMTFMYEGFAIPQPG
ncbi:MAG: class I SAM-dependent methyltransferase [Stellaceae bacterium]